MTDPTAPADAPRVTVAFAMFCQGYDPERPTDLRQMTTGIGGWRPDQPPTIELTLAIGLWNAGQAGTVQCRLGIRRPGDDLVYLGEGQTSVTDPGEMSILPLRFTFTFDRPGTYWAVGEFNGVPVVEVPFTVTDDPPPTLAPGQA